MAAPDMSGMSAMADHWVKMQKLPPKEAVKGCPNFRRIPGYKVILLFSSLFSSWPFHLFQGSDLVHILLLVPLLLVLFLIFVLRFTAAASPPLMASKMCSTRCAETSTPRTARSSG